MAAIQVSNTINSNKISKNGKNIRSQERLSYNIKNSSRQSRSLKTILINLFLANQVKSAPQFGGLSGGGTTGGGLSGGGLSGNPSNSGNQNFGAGGFQNDFGDFDFGAGVNLNNGVTSQTFEFSIDLTFGGPNLLDEYLGNNTQLFNILTHGCWCAKLDATNIFRPFLGGNPRDELDEICRDWFHERICNARRAGGFCLGDTESDTYQVDIIPREEADCRVSRDDDPLEQFTVCEYNTCEIDVKYTKLIEEYLDDHPNFLANQITTAGECGRKYRGIIDYNCDSNYSPVPDNPNDEEYDLEGSFSVADWSRPEENNPSTVHFQIHDDAKISFKLRKWFLSITETALFQLGTGLEGSTGKNFFYPGVFFEENSLDMIFRNSDCEGSVQEVRIPTNFTLTNQDETLVEIYLREPKQQLKVKIGGEEVLNVPWFKFCSGGTHELLYAWQLPPADVDMMDFYYEYLDPSNYNVTSTIAPSTTAIII